VDRACDVCLSYTDIDLGIRGRAIGLLARVLYPTYPPDHATQTPAGPAVNQRCPHRTRTIGERLVPSSPSR
jgi:hypothetical protein